MHLFPFCSPYSCAGDCSAACPALSSTAPIARVLANFLLPLTSRCPLGNLPSILHRPASIYLHLLDTRTPVVRFSPLHILFSHLSPPPPLHDTAAGLCICICICTAPRHSSSGLQTRLVHRPLEHWLTGEGRGSIIVPIDSACRLHHPARHCREAGICAPSPHSNRLVERDPTPHGSQEPNCQVVA